MIHICDNCGIEFNRYRRSKNHNNFCSRKCYMNWWSKYYDGQTIIKERKNTDQGKKHKKFFYRYIYKKDQKRFIEEHRLVMEKHLSRKLKSTDVVHHINEDTLDNRIENLRVFESNLDHLRAHGKGGGQDILYLEQEEMDYIYKIFGTDKYLSDRGGVDPRSLKYGIKTIFYKREPDNIPEISYQEITTTK